MNEYKIDDNSPFEMDEAAPCEGSLDSGRQFIWQGMSVSELTRHMSDIRACLPPLDIAEINLEQQLVLQLHVISELQSRVISNEGIQLNQRVQAASALTKVLGDLADRQVAVYNSERMKKLESALIRAVRDHMDEEAATAFLASYAKIAAEAGA